MTQSSRSQDGHGRFENIGEWQSWQRSIQPDDSEEASENSDLSHLSTRLLSLFKEIILTLPKQTTFSKKARISLERSCSTLIIWSDDHGIAQGCLDDKFKKSSKLRYLLYKNLSNTGRVLTERLLPLAEISSDQLQQLDSSVKSSIENASGILNEYYSDDSSSDAGSTFSNDNLSEVAEDLKTNMYVLSCLEPLIQDPIFDIQQANVVEDFNCSTSSPGSFFVDKIGNRFPLADASLASRLGKANFERYLRCQANREAQDVKEDEEGLHSTEQEAPERSGTIITESKFHDSGVGTSNASRKSYAETLMSYSREGQSVRIPPLPKDAKEGSPFSCVACGRTVCINNNSVWKRHIYLDLQPYLCLDVSCSYNSETFETREKWVSHLALRHGMAPNWHSIECPLCKKETGSGKLAVIRHFSEHLEEISLSALPIEISSNEPSEYGSELSDSVSVSKEPSGNTQETSIDQSAGEKSKHSESLTGDFTTDHKDKSASVADDALVNTQQGIDVHQYEEASVFFDMVKMHCKNQPDKYIRCCNLFLIVKETGSLHESREENEATLLFKIDPALRTQFNKCSLQGLHAEFPIDITVGLDPHRSQPEIPRRLPAARSLLTQQEAPQDEPKIRNPLESHATSHKDFNAESEISDKSHMHKEEKSKSSENNSTPWPLAYEDVDLEDLGEGEGVAQDLFAADYWLNKVSSLVAEKDTLDKADPSHSQGGRYSRLECEANSKDLNLVEPTLTLPETPLPSTVYPISDSSFTKTFPSDRFVVAQKAGPSQDQDERYRCADCDGIAFKHKKDLIRHLETAKAHIRDTITNFRCGCGYISSRKDNFIQHIKRHIGRNSEPYFPSITCSCGQQQNNSGPDATDNIMEHMKRCGQRPRGRPKKDK